MDLLKWIKSLDDLLFELMSWLVFWPLTLVRTVFSPLDMMRYADSQLSRPEEDQYDRALSPPVFLILTLVLAHISSRSLGIRDAIMDDNRGLAAYIDNDASAVALRLVMFAAFPLVFSIVVLSAKRRTLDRSSLRLPFYAQCYPAAVFAAVMSAAGEIGLLNAGPPGTSGWLMLGASVWLIAVEAIWFHRTHGFKWPAATGLAFVGFLVATAIVIASALLLLAH